MFGVSEKKYALSYDDDDDPVLDDLRILDYRYMRFSFHPLKDRFILSNSWKDPAWTDVKSIRAGIDAEEKEKRELVFGKNLIDIKQKTIPQLLLDEVGPFFLNCAASYHSRHSTLSMSSKLQVYFFGRLMSIITMLHAYS